MHARRYRLAALALLCALAMPAGAPAQAPAPAKPLTIEQIFAPEPLIGRLPSSITWAPDGSRFLYTLPGGAAGPLDVHLYDRKKQTDAIFFSAKAEGKGARPTPEFVWSPDSTRLAYLDRGNLMVVNADGRGKHQVAADADDPQWSPDASHLGYIHANDVYAVSAGGGRAVRYSFDGSDDQVNGDPDWVYSEELGMRHAYRWSPDGTHIAYLRFDQRPITKYPLVDFLKTDNTVETTRYPLAGEANSVVSLRIAAAGGATQTLYSTAKHDDYIASLGWTPNGVPTASILDRSQKHFRFLEFTAGTPRVLLAENDAQFLNVYEAGEPRWLPDKHSFLFLSERDGQFSLYRGDAATGTIKRLTRGYRVDGIAGIDTKNGVVFVTAAYPTRRDATVLMVPLRGGIPRALAEGHGSHQFIMAGDARHFMRIDSAFGVPPTYRLGSTLGGEPTIFAQSKSLANLGFGSSELLEVEKLGKLDAYMIKPPDFDPQKKYPVITYVYGGPAAPTTQDRWDGADYLYHQALAQRGFIVFSIDGPGSQIDTAAAVRKLTNKLGPVSLAGQLAGVDYLRTLPYVDPARLGLWGWSFGGYETTYALTHAPGVWKVGVAVAPVTDWAFYDSIYTERYMGKPKSNASAYRESSVIDKADALRDKLLISHGTADDNVHMANTISLIQAFIEHGKQIDFMVYPRRNHGINGIPQRRHLFNHMLNYWQQNL